MDNYKEKNNVFGKASLTSISRVKDSGDKGLCKPKDTFYLVHTFCLLLGLLNVLPLTFFITANGYWMYKFRDTSKDTVDLKNKTTLQTYFTSGSLIVQTVPSMVFMLLSTLVGHKFKVKSRIILALTLILIIFIVFTIFIKVNTDSWQLLFFILSLSGLAVITGILNLLQVTSLVLVPKFPGIYLKTFLFGQGMSGIFNGVLQVISLALGTSTETSALVYFVTGSVVFFVTLLLFILCQKLEFYQHYMKVNVEEKKKAYTRTEIKTVFYKIWPALAILFFWFMTIYLTHPSVTALIISENYGEGSDWSDVYFVPAITFLFTEICSQMGRLLGRPILTKSNGPWLVVLSFIRMVVLVPLVLFCNAQPRSHLSVLLPHDWQYILICIVYFVSSGFLLNVCMLSTPKLSPGNEDLSYLVLLSVIGIMSGALSPLSLVPVQIL